MRSPTKVQQLEADLAYARGQVQVAEAKLAAKERAIEQLKSEARRSERAAQEKIAELSRPRLHPATAAPAGRDLGPRVADELPVEVAEDQP